MEQIRETPYYQYFLGYLGYEDKIQLVPSLLVEFRKRLSEDVLNEIIEMIIEYDAQKNNDDDENKNNQNGGHNDEQQGTQESTENAGTLILDATCAPQNIRYPQDIELLNETREKLENHGVELSESDAELLELLETVYAQQLYMFIWKTHSVDNRIVSISQPYISPIVRGKAKSPVEFGAKLDLSLDEIGMCRIEKLSFDAYNENSVLQTAVENYKKRTLHYTEHILANQIYRSLENITFCNGLDIRLSGK